MTTPRRWIARPPRPARILLLGLAALLGSGGLVQGRADVPQPPAADAGRIDPATFDITAIQKAYRRILARWAAGARSEALADLTALESGVVGTNGKGAARLFKAETQAVRELEEQQHEALLPVLVLHHDSYAAYRELHNPHLSLHARTLAQNLAEIYAARGASEGARVSAARVLTSLGSYLQEVQLMGFSADLYARSLQLDPADEVALLGLGALFEKTGKYDAAGEYLTRLVKAHPGQAEGKLRLALCLERSGKAPEAKRRLEELLSADSSPWVLDLTYEELAALYFREGSYAKAAELLKRGVARFPRNARLYIQLAAALERAGEPAAALKAADKVQTLDLSRDESPRYRYSRWAPDALVQLRAAMRETSDARLAILAQALASAAAKQG
ncbi:MAG TPA: tetratricopeptide repeat protein [Thermoanaerobaculia bacterium]|nr:tetratricopeptide repeat protein [Thermoanaerobaculia bacterium]